MEGVAVTAPGAIRRFYRAHPRMVSSPFGGVDGIDAEALRRVLGALGIEFAGKRVLDIGCGRGYLGGVVEEDGGWYAGLDFVVSRRGFRFALGDAHALPFEDGAFELVCCIDAFEHFPDPGAAAAEIRRVLRPGGVFFLSAPNYANVAGLVKWWCERSGAYAPRTWAPFGRWTPQEFEQPLTPRFVRRVFRRAGFRRFRVAGHGPEVGLGLFPWIDHPRAPEALRLRGQRLFQRIGPAIARCCPAASLHLFWRIES